MRRDAPPVSFVRGAPIVSSGGAVALQVPVPTGLTLGVDGQPRLIEETLRFQWPSGRHRITLGIEHGVRQTPVRLELLDLAGSTAGV